MHRALKNSYESGYRHVLIIEEAHCLPIATLKHLKRLRELETGFTKLLSIILIGQSATGGKRSRGRVRRGSLRPHRRRMPP